MLLPARVSTGPHQLEYWLDRPVRSLMESLQWRILDESKYLGVKTWKFPFDLWVYGELLHEDPPDLLIEVGNKFGGSALWFANLFDAMNHTGRVVAVDIDHSILHPLTSHPRITWIEGDAVDAFEKAKALVRPHDKVMVVEDASHLQ